MGYYFLFFVFAPPNNMLEIEWEGTSRRYIVSKLFTEGSISRRSSGSDFLIFWTAERNQGLNTTYLSLIHKPHNHYNTEGPQDIPRWGLMLTSPYLANWKYATTNFSLPFTAL